MKKRKSHRRRPLHERFWEKVDRSAGESECWEWMASKHRDGYGLFWIEVKLVLTHRITYELANGPIPPGLCVLHHCDNPGCVNPRHLFIGTHTDNMRDCCVKGRQADHRGEKHGRAKLTAEDVLAIKSEYANGDVTQEKLGEKYGVSGRQISNIVRHIEWSHLPLDSNLAVE